MPRNPRITFPNAFYHVMNPGAGQRVIFKNDEQRKSFVALLERVSLEYQAEIHAYCLVENPALPSLDKFYQHGCLPSVLGTKEFKRYLLSSMNILTDVNNQRIEERDALVNRVAAYFNECADDVIETQQGKSKLARLVAIHLSKTHCKQRNSMISAWFGITDSAVSVSLKRFSKRLEKDDKARKALKVLMTQMDRKNE